METMNNPVQSEDGMIGITESRTNIKAMSELYRNEYRKLVDEKNESDKALFHNKWKVRLGTFATRIGLAFQPKGKFRSVSILANKAIGFVAKRVMELKNRIDGKRNKQKRDRLTADFINAEGIFKEFSVPKGQTTIEPDSIEKEKGYSI